MSEHIDGKSSFGKPAGVSTAVIETHAVPRSQPLASPELLELSNRLQIRSDICRFLIKDLGFSTAACYGLIVLQGFHVWDFQMDPTLLKRLCGATIAQSGVLLAVFVNAVWGKGTKSLRKSPAEKVKFLENWKGPKDGKRAR